MKTYTKREIVEKTGLSGPKLQFYINSGILEAVDQFPGRGIERRFDESQVLQCAIANSLSNYKISLGKIREALAFLEKYFPELLKLETYRNPKLSDLFFTIDESGRMQAGGQVDQDTLKRSGKIELDLAGKKSMIVLYFNELAKPLL
jgi:DNA-binding transcriptional MerR regulator